MRWSLDEPPEEPGTPTRSPPASRCWPGGRAAWGRPRTPRASSCIISRPRSSSLSLLALGHMELHGHLPHIPPLNCRLYPLGIKWLGWWVMIWSKYLTLSSLCLKLEHKQSFTYAKISYRCMLVVGNNLEFGLVMMSTHDTCTSYRL